MGVAHKLKHADGTEVAAQEAYDAFINTRVLIVKDETTHEAVQMMWYDTNSTQNNPAAVGFVRLKYVFESGNGAASLSAIDVGDRSLIPTQQG